MSIGSAHSNKWFSWVTEQSPDVAPFLRRNRASGSVFQGFPPMPDIVLIPQSGSQLHVATEVADKFVRPGP